MLTRFVLVVASVFSLAEAQKCWRRIDRQMSYQTIPTGRSVVYHFPPDSRDTPVEPLYINDVQIRAWALDGTSTFTVQVQTYDPQLGRYIAVNPSVSKAACFDFVNNLAGKSSCSSVKIQRVRVIYQCVNPINGQHCNLAVSQLVSICPPKTTTSVSPKHGMLDVWPMIFFPFFLLTCVLVIGFWVYRCFARRTLCFRACLRRQSDIALIETYSQSADTSTIDLDDASNDPVATEVDPPQPVGLGMPMATMPMAKPVADLSTHKTHTVVAAVEPQYFTVTVPDNMSGGAQVTIGTLNGDRVVTIPEGMTEGDQFEVEV